MITRTLSALVPAVALATALVAPTAHAAPGDGLSWSFVGVCSPSVAGVQVAATDGQDHQVTVAVQTLGQVAFVDALVPADGSLTFPTAAVDTGEVFNLSFYDGTVPGDGELIATFHGYVPDSGQNCLVELSTTPVAVGDMALHCEDPVHLSAYLYVSTPGLPRKFTIEFLQDGAIVGGQTSQMSGGYATFTHDITEPGTYMIVVLDDVGLLLESFGPVEVDPAQPDCLPAASDPVDVPVGDPGSPEADGAPVQTSRGDLPSTGADARLAVLAALLVALGAAAVWTARRPVTR